MTEHTRKIDSVDDINLDGTNQVAAVAANLRARARASVADGQGERTDLKETADALDIIIDELTQLKIRTAHLSPTGTFPPEDQ